jgi:general secretion pathway protein A
MALVPYYNRTVQPPASLKALGDPIYEAFYGLNEQPFAITTDPRFFFLSASHQRAFSELLNGLRRRESLLLLTGDSGTGKTTLCRTVLQTLGERTFSALILNPYMSGAEVLRVVLRDFGLVSHEDLRRGALATADVPQLLDTLEGFLKSLVPLGSHAVIVMDEAQSLAPAILDQIRMLTALEHDQQKLVQVVLCGQPGLLQTIKAEPLHALNERITRRVELSPLPPAEIGGYIEHRLGVAGGAEAVTFDAASAALIGELSRGLPRRINVLCDRALQEGRIEGVSVITPDLVKRAARALAGVHDPAPVVPTEPVIRPVPPPDPESSDGLAAAAMAAATATAVPTRELSFGQPLEERPKLLKLALAGLLAVAVAGGAYFSYAWSAGPPAAAVPAAPRPPASLIKPPLEPLTVPTDQQVLEWFPAPAVQPAAPAGMPAAAAAPPVLPPGMSATTPGPIIPPPGGPPAAAPPAASTAAPEASGPPAGMPGAPDSSQNPNDSHQIH